MASPVDTPLVCPTIVGRAPYLTALDGHMDAALAGHGATVVIAGEAGIGKSRLVAETRARAVVRGMHVLVGRSFEPDRVLPYAPLLDVLRTHLAELSADAPIQSLAPAAPTLVAHVPELARFLPVGISPAVNDPAQAQRQIVHAWVRCLTGLASAQPLLVVIEDLHWADDASMEVLLALARQLSARPILLVLTYRSDEASAGVRHLLAQLDRERLAAETTLLLLTPHEVDAMLRAIFDQPQPIRADFLQAIYALTDGNPFFIEEVLRALVATGDIFRAAGRWERRRVEQLRIPRSVQEAVLRRTAHLTPAASQVLRLAAVAGRRFDFAVLQALTGDDESGVLAAIGELIAAQLVVEESADRFAFRHALTRQAIYASLLARERRALHRTIAETIARLHVAAPQAYLADLADHFFAGEVWAEAVDYGERAGNQALALFVPRAAVEHYTRAVDAATHLATGPSAPLLRARGQARATLGDFEGAHVDFQAALARARADGDRVAEWHGLLDLGDLWAGRDYSVAGGYLDQALTLARTLDDPHILAESLTHLGGWYLNTERPDEAEESLQRALEIFEGAGDRRGIARAVDLLGTVSDIAGDIAEMRRRYERAAALFRDLEDRQALCSTLATMLIPGGAYIFETVVVPPHIPVAQTMREAEESLALAREIGWRAGEAYTLLTLAMHHGAYGEYGGALEAARDGLAIAREIDHREWTTAGEWTHGMILTDLFAFAEAREHFRRAYAFGRASGSLHWLHITTATLAESHTALGDLGAAGALVAEIAPDLPMRTLGQRRVWLARAKLALANDDPAGALVLIDGLVASAVGRTGEHEHGIPLLALLRSACLHALQRYDEAIEAVRAAVRIASERGLLPLCWQCHLALARLYVASGRDAAAAGEYQAAWEIIERLAVTLPEGAFRDGYLPHAAALLPPPYRRTARREPGTLTMREREVAALVARGLSNRAIADTLSIGERTVETHISHILGKLDFISRAEIAAWAVTSIVERTPV